MRILYINYNPETNEMSAVYQKDDGSIEETTPHPQTPEFGQAMLEILDQEADS